MRERCETAKSDKKKAEEEYAELQLKVEALELHVSNLDKKVETLQLELHTMKDGREHDREMQEQMKRQGEKLDLLLSKLGIENK